ncbi:MAG: PDZ domain-containing protein, partial [Acidimicrobiia bacterium]|nr:PDZ domain-containing protein [Acidimicrobiia bacterium]
SLALTTADVARELVAERRRTALTRDVPDVPEVLDVNPEVGPPVAGPEGVSDVPVGSEASPEESGPPRLRAWDEDIGLALFEVAGVNGQAFTLSDPRGLPSGSYLGAVTLDEKGRPTIAPGYLVTTVGGPGTEGRQDGVRLGGGEGSAVSDDGGDLVVSMALPSTLSAAAVLDLDGGMVGFAYRSPRGPRVVTTTRMLALVDALQTETICRSIEVSALADEVRQRLGLDSGVLVEYVVVEAFAPEPSLQPGDVLLEWGGTPLESVEQFMQLYDAQAPGSLVRYRVLRGQRRLTGGTVMPARDCVPVRSDPVRLPRFGLAAGWMSADGADAAENDDGVTAGWRVVAVAHEGPAATAGVEEGDWLVSVDGRAVDDRRDRSLLEEAATSEDLLLLSLRRGDRAKLVAVGPSEAEPAEPAEIDGAPVDTDAEGGQ